MSNRAKRNEARLAAQASKEAAEKKQRQVRHRTIAIVCALLSIAVAVGILLGIALQPKKQYVRIDTSEGGTIVIELLPEYAPKTVENFVTLVKDGFYNGLTFHRIIEGFMIQGGDPEGTGYSDSGTDIFGEFASNGYTANTLKHEAGVISMARGNKPNSASSQFFICTGDRSQLEHLDGDYAAFGRVIYGLDHAIALSKTPTDSNDRPLKTVKMTSVTLLTEAEAAEYLK